MCYQTKCSSCGKTTWGGCGRHVLSVYKGIPEGQHCLCRAWPGVKDMDHVHPTGADASQPSSYCSILWWLMNISLYHYLLFVFPLTYRLLLAYACGSIRLCLCKCLFVLFICKFCSQTPSCIVNICAFTDVDGTISVCHAFIHMVSSLSFVN